MNRFDEKLSELAGKMTGEELLKVPEFYGVLSEHFNNEVLEALKSDESGGGELAVRCESTYDDVRCSERKGHQGHHGTRVEWAGAVEAPRLFPWSTPTDTDKREMTFEELVAESATTAAVTPLGDDDGSAAEAPDAPAT